MTRRYTFRPLGPADRDLICRHRHAMFAEGGHSAEALDAMAGPFREWLDHALADRRYFGFIAMHENQPIGGVGLMAMSWPPHPAHPIVAARGYVLNLFVEPCQRGRGIAKELMSVAETEFQRRDLTYLTLHASLAGRPLYEELGWSETSEMARSLSCGARR